MGTDSRAGLAIVGTSVVLAGVLLGGPAWVVRSAEQELERTATTTLEAAGIRATVDYAGFDAQITAESDQLGAARQIVAGIPGTRTVTVTGFGITQPSPSATPAGPSATTSSTRPSPAASAAPRPDLAPIVFEGASSVVSPEDQQRLSELARHLLAHPAATVVLRGYTDNGQDADGRRRLSLARAEAVRQVLVDAGVPRDRVRTIARGSADPAASNDTAEGRARNRRVEIELREG